MTQTAKEVDKAYEAGRQEALSELEERVRSIDEGTKLSKLVYKEDVLQLITEMKADE